VCEDVVGRRGGRGVEVQKSTEYESCGLQGYSLVLSRFKS